jgi:hypothetical protein
LAACFLALSAACAQSTSGGSLPQIPYGQTYRNFQLPYYDGGVLKWQLSAALATGVSLNRAEVTDMKIELFTDGKVTTTVTSPKADLYSSERRMQTKKTVRIDRSDLAATAQRCDFDLVSKQYVLTDHVRVVLKNFDATSGLGPQHSSSAPSASAVTPRPGPGPVAPAPAHGNDSLFDSPGAYSNSSTNLGPIAPTPPAGQ